jgi:hypothetical protein
MISVRLPVFSVLSRLRRCLRAGWQAFWKDRGYMFGEEFRRYVENDLMKREPHPDTKPLGAFPIGRRVE